MKLRIKNLLLIILLLPFYSGVIMLVGNMYGDILGIGAFSFVYKELLKHFQLINGDSLIYFLGFFMTVFSYIVILFIRESLYLD